MSAVVWKYPLAVTDVQDVPLHDSARILSVQMQGHTLCLWALVNPSLAHNGQSRKVRVVGTGHVEDDMLALAFDFVGTVQDVPFVWHIFAESRAAWWNS